MADHFTKTPKVLQAPLHPDLSWGSAIIAILGAVLIPALMGFPFVMQFPDVDPGAWVGTTTLIAFGWHVGAALTVSTMFLIVIVVVATPALWLLLRLGCASYLSLILAAWLVGLPSAHVALNGDLTTEAPDMIVVLLTAMAIQAVTAGVILRILSRRRYARSASTPKNNGVTPHK